VAVTAGLPLGAWLTLGAGAELPRGTLTWDRESSRLLSAFGVALGSERCAAGVLGAAVLVDGDADLAMPVERVSTPGFSGRLRVGALSARAGCSRPGVAAVLAVLVCGGAAAGVASVAPLRSTRGAASAFLEGVARPFAAAALPVLTPGFAVALVRPGRPFSARLVLAVALVPSVRLLARTRSIGIPPARSLTVCGVSGL